MKKNLNYLVIFSIISLAVFSCKKDEDPEPTPAAVVNNQNPDSMNDNDTILVDNGGDSSSTMLCAENSFMANVQGISSSFEIDTVRFPSIGGNRLIVMEARNSSNGLLLISFPEDVTPGTYPIDNRFAIEYIDASGAMFISIVGQGQVIVNTHDTADRQINAMFSGTLANTADINDPSLDISITQGELCVSY